MKTGYLLAAAAAAGLMSSGAFAQSAKFAADCELDTVDLFEMTINVDPTGNPIAGAEEVLATIKAPKGKELLIGVSGFANIVTFTEAKGRNGDGTSTAMAEGIMNLDVRYAVSGTTDIRDNGKQAAPGEITFASRWQELSVTTDLEVIGSTEDLDIEGSVTVALGLDTTAARHFNFVTIDLEESAEYDVVACFTGTGDVNVTETVEGDNKARAFVAVGKRIITVQEVRAVKDSIDPLPTD